jgi:HPt (histidine-containing phosphotransfer) domain-containing protein
MGISGVVERAKKKALQAVPVTHPAAVFDHVQFQSTTMNDASLQDEILQLFNDQLKTMREKMAFGNFSPEDCKFLGHTLRGSAAAVGALEIEALATACEEAQQMETEFAVAFEAATERFKLETERYHRFSKRLG